MIKGKSKQGARDKEIRIEIKLTFFELQQLIIDIYANPLTYLTQQLLNVLEKAIEVSDEPTYRNR